MGGGLLGRVLVRPVALPTLDAWADRCPGLSATVMSPRTTEPKAVAATDSTCPLSIGTSIRFVDEEAGFFDNDALSGVERAKAGSHWQEGSRSHLGQRPSWHVSKEVRRSHFQPHNREVEESGEG